MTILGYDIRIVRSGRKTVSLEIKPDGTILVRAPYYMPEREIVSFVRSREGWLKTHLKKTEERLKALDGVPAYTEDEMRAVAEGALRLLPQRVAYYAPLVGVDYGRITIRSQRIWRQ